MSQGNYDWEGEAIALRAQLKNTDKAYESNRRLAEDLVQEKIAMQKRTAEMETERDAMREALLLIGYDSSLTGIECSQLAQDVLERFKKE